MKILLLREPKRRRFTCVWTDDAWIITLIAVQEQLEFQRAAHGKRLQSSRYHCVQRTTQGTYLCLSNPPLALSQPPGARSSIGCPNSLYGLTLCRAHIALDWLILLPSTLQPHVCSIQKNACMKTRPSSVAGSSTTHRYQTPPHDNACANTRGDQSNP